MMPKNLEVLMILLDDDDENPIIDYSEFKKTIIWDLFGISIELKHDKEIVVDYAKLIQQRWIGEPDNPASYMFRIGQQNE